MIDAFCNVPSSASTREVEPILVKGQINKSSRKAIIHFWYEENEKIGLWHWKDNTQCELVE